MNVTLGVAALIAMVLFPTLGGAQPAAIDLGTLGGTNSNTVAINDHGQVVGNSDLLPGEIVSHAFSWTAAGGMVDLGTLGGSYSQAFAINDNGQVVGESSLPGDTITHAFLWTAASGMVDLGTLGGEGSRASAINDNGQAVGESSLPGDTVTHAFLWTAANGMVDLGTLGGVGSRASAINDNGQVVGNSDRPSGERGPHAFSWTAAGGMVDLGTLDFEDFFSYALAVNNHGQVVGYSGGGAFSWTAAGGMTSLGGPYATRAFAVNDNGQVVGGSFIGFAYIPYGALLWTAAGGVVVLGEAQAVAINDNGQVAANDYGNAFTWTATGGRVDLEGPGGSRSWADAINDNGQVVGNIGGYTPDREEFWQHAALWNTRSYNFRFSGVKKPPAFNEVVAGRAVSVSFSLGGNFGLAIFDEGLPTFDRIACGASAGVGPIAPTSGALSGSVIYKPQVDRYAYASKTDRTWAGTCRSLTLRLNDGSSHVVYFSFK